MLHMTQLTYKVALQTHFESIHSLQTHLNFTLQKTGETLWEVADDHDL